MSACHDSRYTQAAPLRRPPWLTAATDESSVRSHGTMPLDRPLVPVIRLPLARTRCQATPMPPANFDSLAMSV